jgi:hypothetical protein
MRDYWILRKGKEYISDIDEFGLPWHTKDVNKALKFYYFPDVMNYVSMGYCAVKNF